MVVSEAVRTAKDAAHQYASAGDGIRVEEVEQTESGWNITLSWLEENTEARIRRDADPMRRAFGEMLGAKAPLLERVYRMFVIREGQAVRMIRTRDP